MGEIQIISFKSYSVPASDGQRGLCPIIYEDMWI